MAGRRVGLWNGVAFTLYVAVAFVGLAVAQMSVLAFAMSTDGCHDAACEASYHVGAALLTVLIGFGAVLLLTLIAMVLRAAKGKIVLGWPVLGLVALAGVWVAALSVLH